MLQGFGNYAGLTGAKIGYFLMDFFFFRLFGFCFFLVGKYQIMAPDVIPPKCFALKRAQHPRCRQQPWRSLQTRQAEAPKVHRGGWLCCWSWEMAICGMTSPSWLLGAVFCSLKLPFLMSSMKSEELRVLWGNFETSNSVLVFLCGLFFSKNE